MAEKLVRLTIAGDTVRKTLDIIPEADQPALAVRDFSTTAGFSLCDLSGTWNTAGGPTALKLNITDDASGAASLLMDLQIATVSQFKVSKAGDATALGSLTAGNALFNVTGTTGVLKLANGTDPAANPTNATTQWAVGGEWQYRSSAASEGAGQTNRVHNRAAMVTGAGTDYTLTTSMARVDFGTTDPEIVLPTAGTYLIIAQTRYNANGSGAIDIGGIQLRNSTDSVFVGVIGYFEGAVASGIETGFVTAILTVSASKTIQLWAINASSARGTLTSADTYISYIRLF